MAKESVWSIEELLNTDVSTITDSLKSSKELLQLIDTIETEIKVIENEFVLDEETSEHFNKRKAALAETTSQVANYTSTCNEMFNTLDKNTRSFVDLHAELLDIFEEAKEKTEILTMLKTMKRLRKIEKILNNRFDNISNKSKVEAQDVHLIAESITHFDTLQGYNMNIEWLKSIESKMSKFKTNLPLLLVNALLNSLSSKNIDQFRQLLTAAKSLKGQHGSAILRSLVTRLCLSLTHDTLLSITAKEFKLKTIQDTKRVSFNKANIEFKESYIQEKMEKFIQIMKLLQNKVVQSSFSEVSINTETKTILQTLLKNIFEKSNNREIIFNNSIYQKFRALCIDILIKENSFHVAYVEEVFGFMNKEFIDYLRKRSKSKISSLKISLKPYQGKSIEELEESITTMFYSNDTKPFNLLNYKISQTVDEIKQVSLLQETILDPSVYSFTTTLVHNFDHSFKEDINKLSQECKTLICRKLIKLVRNQPEYFIYNRSNATEMRQCFKVNVSLFNIIKVLASNYKPLQEYKLLFIQALSHSIFYQVNKAASNVLEAYIADSTSIFDELRAMCQGFFADTEYTQIHDNVVFAILLDQSMNNIPQQEQENKAFETARLDLKFFIEANKHTKSDKGKSISELLHVSNDELVGWLLSLRTKNTFTKALTLLQQLEREA